MSVLIFVPLALLAAVAEMPWKPQRRPAYRKRPGREFHAGRSW